MAKNKKKVVVETKKLEIIHKFNYFKFEEFDQPGLEDSGKKFMDIRLIMILDNMRHRSQIPYKITSGYRSQEYNDALKNSSKNSSHIKGKAADIAAPDSKTRYSIIEAALHFGIQRIGISKAGGFIHIDIDDKDKPAEICWIY